MEHLARPARRQLLSQKAVVSLRSSCCVLRRSISSTHSIHVAVHFLSSRSGLVRRLCSLYLNGSSYSDRKHLRGVWYPVVVCVLNRCDGTDLVFDNKSGQAFLYDFRNRATIIRNHWRGVRNRSPHRRFEGYLEQVQDVAVCHDRTDGPGVTNQAVRRNARAAWFFRN